MRTLYSLKEIKLKLNFLKVIEGIHDELQIVGALEKVSNDAFHLIQELHCRQPHHPLVEIAKNRALILINYLLENPRYAEKVIWPIRDLLGQEHDMFFTTEINSDHVALIRDKIEKLGYKNFPYVIVARYVPAKYRKELVESVINYADQPLHSMSWASTAEACQTLAYLNCSPEESIECLGRHLNSGDICDGEPYHSVLFALPVFKKHLPLIIQPLKTFIGNGYNDSSIAIHQLSNSIVGPEVARELLPVYTKALIANDVVEWIQDGMIFNSEFDEGKDLLSLLGQMSLLASKIP